MGCPEIRKLYKYRNFSARNLSMLANNEIFFAPSNTFNDPFDCGARRDFEFENPNDFIQKMASVTAKHEKISKESAKTYLAEIASSPKKMGVFIADMSAYFQKEVLQSFGIYSLSEIKDDILMWSHYSDGHKGFCIEFDKTENNFLEYVLPVHYPKNDEFPKIDYWKKPDELLEEFKKIILTKSKHWAYEKEWRIIDKPNPMPENYLGHIKKFSDNMLSGIIFGARMPENDRKTIRGILSGKKVEFFESRIVKNRFLVEIVKCSSHDII